MTCLRVGPLSTIAQRHGSSGGGEKEGPSNEDWLPQLLRRSWSGASLMLPPELSASPSFMSVERLKYHLLPLCAPKYRPVCDYGAAASIAKPFPLQLRGQMGPSWSYSW